MEANRKPRKKTPRTSGQPTEEEAIEVWSAFKV